MNQSLVLQWIFIKFFDSDEWDVVGEWKTAKAQIHLVAAAAARLHGDGRLGRGVERKATIYEDDDDD